MFLKSEAYKNKFMSLDPTVYAEGLTLQGHKVKYLEHPTMGDCSTVYALVTLNPSGNTVLIDTEFFDVLTNEGLDYQIYFVDGEPMHYFESGEMV